MNDNTDILLHEICADPELLIKQETVTKDPQADFKTTDVQPLP